VLYSASGTALPNETSIATNNAVTVTLPTAPPNGTVNTISSTAYGFTIARGGLTDTITYIILGSTFSGATSISASGNGVRRFVYNSGVWTEIGAPALNAAVGILSTYSGGTGAGTVSGARGTLGITPGSVFPSAHGVKAWTFDPATIASSSTIIPTKGVAYATRIHMTTAATVSTVGFFTNAGSGASMVNSYVSLYSAAGAVLGYASLGSALLNTGYNTFTLTAVGSLALANDTDYYIVFQIGTSTTTAPALVVAGDSSGGGPPNTGALMNFNTTNAAGALNGRCSFWGTSLNTTPAAVGANTPAFNQSNFFATLN